MKEKKVEDGVEGYALLASILGALAIWLGVWLNSLESAWFMVLGVPLMIVGIMLLGVTMIHLLAPDG